MLIVAHLNVSAHDTWVLDHMNTLVRVDYLQNELCKEEGLWKSIQD